MRNQVRLEPCVTCNHSGCGTMIVLKTLASEKIELDDEADFLTITCTACGRPFSTSIFKLGWVEVEISKSHEPLDEGEEPVVSACSETRRILHQARYAA